MKKSRNRQKQHAVGYGKPPIHTQFQKGKSGNRRGRPKTKKSVPMLILDEWNRKIVITENGVRRKISKGEAIAKQLANRAAAGDQSATRILMNIMRHCGSLEKSTIQKTIVIRANLPALPPHGRTPENWNDRKEIIIEEPVAPGTWL
jgi:Family of unknown function (DUF5681)